MGRSSALSLICVHLLVAPRLLAMNNQLKYRRVRSKRVSKETEEVEAMVAEEADFCVR